MNTVSRIGPLLGADAALEVGLRMGIPRDKLERSLGLQSASDPALPVVAHARVTLPVTLVVPWTLLISDDERMGAPQVRRTKDGRYVAQNTLSKEYREAKAQLRKRFRTQLGPALPYEGPVHVTYAFYWPDRRRHDASNHLKLLNDVLSKLVIADDCQIEAANWRTFLDPDAPRCELEIRPLTPTR